MKEKATRKRIIKGAVTYFNQHGVANSSTNHIAAHLKMSPGNLYYHFRNKEEIVRDIFLDMTDEVEDLWKNFADYSQDGFIRQTFTIFARYRFFHREMYQLRRRDPTLSRMWRRHIQNSRMQLERAVENWQESHVPRNPETSPENKQVLKERRDILVQAILASSSSFMFFYEGVGKSPVSGAIDQGCRHIEHLKGFLSI